MKKRVKGAKKRSSSHATGERDILEEQVGAFEKKFGRPPGPNDPVFFDPDADVPRAMPMEKINKGIFVAMQTAGTPQHIVYAFKKTGLLLLDELKPTYPPEAVAKWDAAVEEYWAMAADGNHSDIRSDDGHRMTIPATEIPGLAEMPLSADEQRFIFVCLGAIDKHLETQSTSLRVKAELAAAVLVMGASSAFDSASNLDQPEEAEAAYDLFVNLVMLRARELFERQRR